MPFTSSNRCHGMWSHGALEEVRLDEMLAGMRKAEVSLTSTYSAALSAVADAKHTDGSNFRHGAKTALPSAIELAKTLGCIHHGDLHVLWS